MKYLGSKRKHAKYLLSTILEFHSTEAYYVEPFCGGCNMIDKVPGKRIAADINEYLIDLFKYVQSGGVLPSAISEKEYFFVKDNKELFDTWYVAFVGFCSSFAGKWFNGYARNNVKNDYISQSKNSFKKQLPGLFDIDFRCCPYDELNIPDGSTVYLDPPYFNTTGYLNKIEHDHFWDWVRALSLRCRVYISEYAAPDDFFLICKIKTLNQVSHIQKNSVEKIYVPIEQAKRDYPYLF